MRRILRKHEGKYEIQGEDREKVLELLGLHPNADKKLGPGVRRLYQAYDPAGNRCFRIVRNDGVDTDISFKKCITHPSPKAYYMEAARRAVADQIADFKNFVLAKGAFTCPVSGETVDRSNCHVDHEEPLTFEKLALDFLRMKGVPIESVRLTARGYGRGFTDSAWEQEWAEYHRRHARLQAVSRRANLSYLRRCDMAVDWDRLRKILVKCAQGAGKGPMGSHAGADLSTFEENYIYKAMIEDRDRYWKLKAEVDEEVKSCGSTPK